LRIESSQGLLDGAERVGGYLYEGVEEMTGVRLCLAGKNYDQTQPQSGSPVLANSVQRPSVANDLFTATSRRNGVGALSFP